MSKSVLPAVESAGCSVLAGHPGPVVVAVDDAGADVDLSDRRGRIDDARSETVMLSRNCKLSDRVWLH